MQVQISYIHHNCFILKIGRTALLFDYPGDGFLDETRRAAVFAGIQNTDLFVFASHFHPDHFNPRLAELQPYPRRIFYILSSDILKKNRQLANLPECYAASPDQVYRIGDLEARAFLSNDEGVAYLIKYRDTNIYFGGDLANWNWDGLSPAERRLCVDYFAEVLEKLRQWPIAIAFSNADPRLPNWSGAAQFAETVKPKLFVPMHAFGETEKIGQFVKKNPNLPCRIFEYRNTGDSITLELRREGTRR